MPIFDFQCADCGHHFDALIRNDEKKNIHCTNCNSVNVKQKLSLFNTSGNGRFSNDAHSHEHSGCCGCNARNSCEMAR
ncbi:MAG: zinc ribbon domain-containing protein [Syntrophomonadaceae bacterium]|nr:zinc ribbon domain-containing protein [Syntrophomonadaceae bacterium]